ncbi:MAG: tryptophan-rich sensory protein [Anaerolineales bacterium]|nr:MAG: tryptophan-rich sensory protein [Anaerolineales bacterium]
MKKISVGQILNVLVTVAVLTINILANALPINGQNTGEISDRFAIYFVPAGYVFSIWGLIYLGLIAFAIYQALPKNRDTLWLKRITPYYILGNFANIVWIFLWHYNQFPLTLIAMLVILGSLLAITVALMKTSDARGAGVRWFVKAPFSLYVGWISVATVANVTQVLYFLNWGGWGIAPEVWALMMLVVAAVIAGLNLVLRRDNIYVLVFVWAYIGIAVQHNTTALVMLPAALLAGALGLLVVLNLFGFMKPASKVPLATA